jgi:hypothetical protein
MNELDQLKLERDTMAHGFRVASDNCVRLERLLAAHRQLLEEFVAYCGEPAGMTVDVVRDPSACAAFFQAVEQQRAGLLARAAILLHGHSAPPGENHYDYRPK